MAKFKGVSNCLTGDCGGHKAGYRYAMQGGTTQPHRNARSFANGMAIANGTFKKPKGNILSKKNVAIGLGIAAAISKLNKP